ncbi:hypothetical protein [Micromonospora sp. KC207]|nr:hypothetical protein [Micromonospora sp. KC207]
MIRVSGGLMVREEVRLPGQVGAGFVDAGARRPAGFRAAGAAYS